MSEKTEDMKKLEAKIGKIFPKGKIRNQIAMEFMKNYNALKTEAKNEEELEEKLKEKRVELAAKFTKPKETVKKAQSRVTNVISLLRRKGMYTDTYTQKKKKKVEKNMKDAKKLVKNIADEKGTVTTPKTVKKTVTIKPSEDDPRVESEDERKEKIVDIMSKIAEMPPDDQSRIARQILEEKPNEKSRERIGAMAKELGVKTEDLEAFIEETRKPQIAQAMAEPPPEKRENTAISNGSLRTVPIVVKGRQLKVPASPPRKEPVSPVTPTIQVVPKTLAEAIGAILDERDERIKLAAEEQVRRNEEENRRALKRVAKQFNVKPENLPKLLNQKLRENMLNRNNDPGRNLSDSQKLSRVMEQLPPEQLRILLKKKTGTTENPMLAAFKHMDTEASLVDIMDELNLDFDRAIDLQTKYNQMKRLELERQQLDEPYLKAWFDMANTIGRTMRANCSYYHEVNGICKFWRLDEISKQYRDTFRGLYRSAAKKEGGYYINVNNHPEVCAICSIGTLKMRGLEK